MENNDIALKTTLKPLDSGDFVSVESNNIIYLQYFLISSLGKI